jgi:hypothetical protein
LIIVGELPLQPMPSLNILWGFAAAHEFLLMLCTEPACLVNHVRCFGHMRDVGLRQLVGLIKWALGALVSCHLRV